MLGGFTSCHRKAKATVEPPIKVKTLMALPTDLTVSRAYSGTVEEAKGSTLSFAAAGTVSQVMVNEGDRISKGQLLATLDGSTLRNSHDITVAALNQAQDTYERMKRLHEAKAIPDIKWVEVENALRSAQSAEQIARKALSDANLYSTQSGYVAEKYIDPGMNVIPGMPAVKVVDISDVKVNVSIAENDIHNITLGGEARIKVGALGDRRFSGKICERGVAANALSRSYDVKILVSNPEGLLLPGMLCDVELVNDSVETAVVLPINTVLVDADNQNFVWIARDGRAHKRIVEVEGITDQGIIINPKDLQGDSIICEGLQKVSENSPIVNITK